MTTTQSRKTFQVALMGLLALQIILIFVTRSSKAEFAAFEEQPLIGEFNPEGVTEIELWPSRSPSDEADPSPLVLRKDGDGWVLPGYENYAAKSEAVDALLRSAQKVVVGRPLSAKKARQGQLGVSETDYKGKLVLTSGDRSERMYLGNPAGTGRDSIRLDGRDEIYAQSQLRGNKVSADVSKWIDTRYHEEAKADIRWMRIQQGDHDYLIEQLEDGAGYKVSIDGALVEIPEGKELDTSIVESIRGEVSSVTIKEPVAAKNISELPRATIFVRSAKAKGDDGAEAPGVEWQLEVYKQGEKFIARDMSRAFGGVVAESEFQTILGLVTDNWVKEIPAEPEAPAGMPPGMQGMPPGGMPNMLPGH